jgi:hypothetical protein
MTRFQVLAGGRRYSHAAAFARDPRSRPEEIPSELAESLARTADALAAGAGGDALLARGANAPVNLELVPLTAPLTAALGDADRAFRLLQAYLLGGEVAGQQFAPPGPVDRRNVSVLFAPDILALRADRRHAALLERVGLERYWLATRTRPDFRRA